MRGLARILEVVSFTFGAWLLCGFAVYAGSSWLPKDGKTAFHYAMIIVMFASVFRLYFRRPDPVAPAAAAAVAIAFIALLDLLFLSPYYLHSYYVFMRFWEWQLPAMLVAAAIYGAGRRKRLTVPS
jgi:hypothetical protein